MPAPSPQRQQGFTLIELIVVMAIVALLVSIAASRYLQRLERACEASLRSSLQAMRAAIDQHTADIGHYPDSLEALVAGRYLREPPEDPLTGGVWDVRSGAAGRGRGAGLFADG